HGMQGTPYIYQGEELGMTNVQYDIEDYKDCEIINMYHERLEKGYSKDEIMKSIYAKGRDNARTPMQWSDEINGGFSKGTPWIESIKNYKEINVKNQIDDEDSIFNYYRKLIALRKEHRVIALGKTIPLAENDKNVYMFKRVLENEELLVVTNFYNVECSIELDFEIEGYECILSNNGEKVTLEKNLKLQPYDALVFLKK
ncbi:alpha-glucosidase C-terminal domain-containing protein, partial [uncultured Fusobacterium sp.]|uniref:alpha-amylase family glycosyl hydrolase n=1 Tax=uncultured Fusobacterium sp. TaxID=159267 RepID=UPI0025D41FD6